MTDLVSDRRSFEEFVERVEPRLRVALVAVFGPHTGCDATAEALAYGWEHWNRVSAMDNPAGYLYRVGRSSQRRRKRRPWLPVPEQVTPMVEPGLPAALASLSEKQRLAVVLVHADGWTRAQAAGWMGVSLSALDTHLARGLRRLRAELGVKSHA